MAKVGRKRKDLQRHKLLGTHRAKAYEREGKPKIETFVKTRAVRVVEDFSELLRLLPGYDPEMTKGDCVFDTDTATRALSFFANKLKFIEGSKANKPFALERWQKAIIACLFGYKRPDGMRRYREAFIFVPRKNGKSPLCAGIVCYTAFEDGEMGAQIYSAAAEREQAALVFRHAKGMILKDEGLSQRCKIYASYKSMEFPETDGLYKALSAEADTKDGLNSHLVIIDELHAQPNRELVDVLMTSTGSRTQPLIIHITTAGYDRNSICYEKYDYACKVRDGIIDDPSFLPVIYEAAESDAWDDEATWYKANPNLGVSVSLDYLQRECRRAKDTAAYENTFRRLHLNQWTTSDSKFISIDKWNKCGLANFDISSLDGRPCWAGLDMSTTTDLTAFTMLFPFDDGRLFVLPQAWCPKDNARKRELKDRVPYETWARQGYIEMTEGNEIDYRLVRHRIIDLGKKYKIQGIAVDRYNAAQITQELKEQDGFNVVAHGQGFLSMSTPTKELNRLINSEKLVHNCNPLLTWCASNLSVETDAAENYKPTKKKSTERIDPMVALIMAISLYGTKQIEQPSVYEERGVRVI